MDQVRFVALNPIYLVIMNAVPIAKHSISLAAATVTLFLPFLSAIASEPKAAGPGEFAGSDNLPARMVAVLEHPDEVTIYSMETDEAKNAFHGFKILGSTKLEDREAKQAVSQSLKLSSYAKNNSLCFFQPHHGIRFRKGTHLLDYVICCHCAQIKIVYDDEYWKNTLVCCSPSMDLEGLLNRILQKQNIPQSKSYLSDLAERRLGLTTDLLSRDLDVRSEERLLQELAAARKGNDKKQEVGFLGALSLFYYSRMQAKIAESYFSKALALGSKTLGANHPDMARLYANMGFLYVPDGEFKKAEAMLLKANAIFSKSGKDDACLAKTLGALGDLYFAKGDFTMADQCYGKSLAMFKRLGVTKGENVRIQDNQRRMLYLRQIKG